MDLEISMIRMDGGTQPRAAISPVLVSEYAEAMGAGTAFPAVVVYHDGTSHWLADGFHRVRAAQEAGRVTVDADVRQGTLRDAILYSAGANGDHGLRRSNEDKRRAVLVLLRDPEWIQWSDSEIGRRARVSHTYVARLRAELTCNVSSGNDGDAHQQAPIAPATPVLRHGADGRTIDTAKIGPRPAAPPEREWQGPNFKGSTGKKRDRPGFSGGTGGARSSVSGYAPGRDRGGFAAETDGGFWEDGMDTGFVDDVGGGEELDESEAGLNRKLRQRGLLCQIAGLVQQALAALVAGRDAAGALREIGALAQRGEER